MLPDDVGHVSHTAVVDLDISLIEDVLQLMRFGKCLSRSLRKTFQCYCSHFFKRRIELYDFTKSLPLLVPVT